MPTRWDPQPNTDVQVPPRYAPITEWRGTGTAAALLDDAGGVRCWVVVQGERVTVACTRPGQTVVRALERSCADDLPAAAALSRLLAEYPHRLHHGADLAQLRRRLATMLGG